MTEVLVDGCTAYVEVANSAGLQMFELVLCYFVFFNDFGERKVSLI